MEGRQERSAFYIFIDRHKIEQASYANSLLVIIADPPFCRTLVRKAPWAVAVMLREIGEKQLHAGAAELCVQELGHQAILQDDGMLNRELDYHGFGSAPLLSDNLFSNPFIVERYDPINRYFPSEMMTSPVLKRFNSAALRCCKTIIDHGLGERGRHTANSAVSSYRSAFLRLYAIQKSEF